MSAISLTGDDTVVINNRVLLDFAEGNVAELTFPNELAKVKTGKNGNAIYALDASGRVADLKLRVLRGSADDKFLNGLMANQKNNFAGFPLLIGQFVKMVGNGANPGPTTITSDTYILGGGIFTKGVEVKTNVEGDTEQSVAVYTMRFSSAPRVIT